ncbi:hypothetical protein JCM8097_004308 [Rhodosporidiobolus ruineniae]
MQRDPNSWSSWMLSTARTADDFYAEGRKVSAKGAWDLAVERYSRAQKLCKPDAHPTQRALYFACRSRCHLRLKDYLKAELDSRCALRLVVGKTSSTFELESALSDEWLQLIEEWKEALSKVTEEKTYPTAKVRGVLEELEVQVDKLDDDLEEAPHPRPRSGIMPREAVLSTSSDDITIVPLSTKSSSIAEKLHTIHSAHNALSILWKEKGDNLVAAWRNMPDEPDRLFLCADAVGRDDTVDKDDWELHPELEYGELYLKDHLLDLISTRALRSPDISAFLVDLPSIRSSVSPCNTSLSSLISPLTLDPSSSPVPSKIMLLTDDPYGAPYGSILSPSSAPSAADRAALRRAFVEGEACTPAEGEALIERQRLLYIVALRAARLLYLADPDAEDREQARQYSFPWRYGTRAFEGRKTRDGGWYETVFRDLSERAEEQYELLSQDPEDLANRLYDSASSPNGRVKLSHAKAALRRLVLNTYTRHYLLQEIDEAYSAAFGFSRQLGSSSSVPLPRDYERRMSTFAALLDEYVKVVWSGFVASVRSNYGSPTMADLRRFEVAYAPLSLLFQKAATLDPLEHIYEVLDLFGYIGEYTKYSSVLTLRGFPVISSEIPYQLRLIFEEVRDILRLRESVVDTHRPRFNRDEVNISNFLNGLPDLLSKLSHSFNAAITPGDLVDFLNSPSDALLDSFLDRVSSDLDSDPDSLFSALLTDFDNDTPVTRPGYESSEEEESDVDSLELPELEEVEVPIEQRAVPPTVAIAHAPSLDIESEEEETDGGGRRIELFSMRMMGSDEEDEEEEEEEEEAEVEVEVPRRRVREQTSTPKTKRWHERLASRPERESKRAKKVVEAKEAVKGQTQRFELPKTVVFEVRPKIMEYWEKLLGGRNLKRSRLSQNGFLHAVHAIGFTCQPAQDGGMIFPSYNPAWQHLKKCKPMLFHQAHIGGKYFIETQVFDLRHRLHEHYGFTIDHFTIGDGSSSSS